MIPCTQPLSHNPHTCLSPTPERTGEHAPTIGNTTHTSVLHSSLSGMSTAHPGVPDEALPYGHCHHASCLACQTPTAFVFLPPACQGPSGQRSHTLRPGCGLAPSLHPHWEKEHGKGAPREEGSPSAPHPPRCSMGRRVLREGREYTAPLVQHSLSAYNPVPAAELSPSP